MKRCALIRHMPWEGLAGFRLPIEQAGFAIETIDAGNAVAGDLAAIDWLASDLLVTMGGPMGVYEQAAHPWIADELAGLSARIAAGRPTLGICLGSQMIAAALGARVFAGAIKEVGFAEIAVNEAGMASPLRHLAGVPVLHWHGDTFDLPEGCELLASTSLYPNQAFRRGTTLLALQCHPEMGEDPQIDHWIAGADAYMAGAGTDAARVRADHGRFGPAAVAAGRALLAEWLAAAD